MNEHHSLLYIGAHESCLSHIPLAHRSGVDSELFAREQFDIDDARRLRDVAVTRPIESDKRHFVISARQLTFEAQHALLKLFEDPPATAQFYLIVPRADMLLPTLRSRLHLAHESLVTDDASDSQTPLFLAASYADRLEQIAKLTKTKDVPAMRSLIAGIERALAARAAEHRETGILCDSLMASTYAETRGASHKMLLEHLALSLS